MKAIKPDPLIAEKKTMRFALVFLILISIVARVQAQIDPSSAMLLNSGSRANVRDSGLDSGRYTVRPHADRPEKADRVEKAERIERTTRKTTTTEVVVEKPTPVAAAPATPTATPAVPPTPTPAAAPTPPATPTPIPFQSSFAQDDDEDETPVVTQAPIDARRMTMLEISFAPGYLYNESKSTFAPRNYFVNSPAAGVDASVWMSPAFGVHTSFLGSLNANVSDSLDNTKNASASEQWFAAGLRVRKFFGETNLAPTLQLGLDYQEYQFRIPSDSKMRNKLFTSGLMFNLDAEIPTSGFGSWTIGTEFGPKLQHREISTGTEFRTGDDVATATFGAHFGARYRFDRTQSMFWKASYSAERNLFSGSTSLNDPLTGQPQSNVSVTNSTLIFQLGYTWSD